MVEISAVLPGQGLVFEGHLHEDASEFDEALAAAAGWLVEQGRSRREAQHLTTWRPGLVANDAHVGDHPDGGQHFVQDGHDGGRPVTVVHVPVPWVEVPPPPLPPQAEQRPGRRRATQRELPRCWPEDVA